MPSASNDLRFASALSTHAATAEAIDEVCTTALAALAAPVSLAIAFVSQHHAAEFGQHAAALCQRLGTEKLLACTGESIAGRGQEVEGEPAVSLWLAHLPGTQLQTMALQFERSAEGGSFTGWPSDLPEPWPADAAMLLLAEPFTFPADDLLRRLNDDQPGIPVLGGMASGGSQPGENRIWLGSQELKGGAVAVLLHGGVRVRSIVSQGCKPIGRAMVITKGEQNVIRELGGLPAMERLQETYLTLDADDQRLIRHGLHVGRVISEYQESFERGDFLVRNVIGADPSAGAIAIGDFVRPGQTVQFHLRDGRTADEDLREMLATTAASGVGPSAGALLFTCNGRGTNLFDGPHHDAGCVAQALGDIPLAGFFAQGEMGPVSGKNFLHGFTASIALFDAPPQP